MPKYEPNPFRAYSPEDVKRLRGSYDIDYTISRLGSNRLWDLFNTDPNPLRSLGCMDGNQAIEMVLAGATTLYCSGWQTSARQLLPDMGLYNSESVPNLVKELNSALLAADRYEHSSGGAKRNWLVPIIADMDNGFSTIKNTYLLMRNMIESGASCLHIEDLHEKKCGHMSGRCVVPTSAHVKRLISARLASDVCNVPVLIVARTDINGSKYVMSDADPQDHRFINFDKRTDDGFYELKGDPVERSVARALSFASVSDAVWMETDKPDLGEAAAFAHGVHEHAKDKLLFYNCSPSFNWKRHLSDKEIAEFQDKLGELGFRFNFITLASFHSNNLSSYKLANAYQTEGMTAFVRLQQEALDWQATKGYTAVKHQSFVGTGYWDDIQQIVDGHGNTAALANSTEAHQF